MANSSGWTLFSAMVRAKPSSCGDRVCPSNRDIRRGRLRRRRGHCSRFRRAEDSLHGVGRRAQFGNGGQQFVQRAAWGRHVAGDGRDQFAIDAAHRHRDGDHALHEFLVVDAHAAAGDAFQFRSSGKVGAGGTALGSWQKAIGVKEESQIAPTSSVIN